jgi:hypothetical protein
MLRRSHSRNLESDLRVVARASTNRRPWSGSESTTDKQTSGCCVKLESPSIPVRRQNCPWVGRNYCMCAFACKHYFNYSSFNSTQGYNNCSRGWLQTYLKVRPSHVIPRRISYFIEAVRNECLLFKLNASWSGRFLSKPCEA